MATPSTQREGLRARSAGEGPGRSCEQAPAPVPGDPFQDTDRTIAGGHGQGEQFGDAHSGGRRAPALD